MNNYNEAIKDSEVNVALMVEKTKSSDAIIYRELKRRKLLCKLLHKQHTIDSACNNLKVYYCCHKCYCVWGIYRKKK